MQSIRLTPENRDLIHVLLESILNQMICIPAASFMQGSNRSEIDECIQEWSDRLIDPNYTREMFTQWITKEYPPFRVKLKKYSIAKFPVTNGQFEIYVSITDARKPDSLKLKKPSDHPVWGLTLSDVTGYISWLNSITDQTFRLPSEAQWEYAAKGPRNYKYPFGNVFDPACCNTIESGIGDTTPVDAYEDYCSPFGVCDLAGNVEEWTSDKYLPYPGGTMVKDDLYHRLGRNYPITRGGSFALGGDLARCTRRHGPYPSDPFKYLGFRLTISTLL